MIQHSHSHLKLSRGGSSSEPGTVGAYANQCRAMGLREEQPLPTQDEWGDWQWQLAHGFGGTRDALQLAGARHAGKLKCTVERYRFAVTPYYFSLADWGNRHDPIRMQAFPDERELEGPAMDCAEDPFDETSHAPVPGVVHRFADRALVMASAHCAVYCRHCTRKNKLAQQREPTARHDFARAIDYIRNTPSVREVLVSGGDPLLIPIALLDWLLAELHAIEHVEVLRIGTRVPVVLPMRLTAAMCDLLAAHRPLWVNTQFNHPRELTPRAMAACEALVSRGIPVSNQAVLMRGINDDVEVLADLCNGLQRHLVRPYYVFLCDPIIGISHLRTSAATAGKLARALATRVGGLSMPRFVADVPGAPCKQSPV